MQTFEFIIYKENRKELKLYVIKEQISKPSFCPKKRSVTTRSCYSLLSRRSRERDSTILFARLSFLHVCTVSVSIIKLQGL